MDSHSNEECPRGPLLTAEEELHLHQLTQLKLWQQRGVRGAEPLTAHSPSDRPPLPATWELLRGVRLSSWQSECVDRWFTNDHRGVVKVVTGAGKTILALAVAERLQRTECSELRVAIVVPTVVLASQWRQELLERSNLPQHAIGQLGSGSHDHFDEHIRVMVCILNSAAKKLPTDVERSGVGKTLLLIVDECHRAGAREMQHVFETARAFNLGLSATPERDNDAPDEMDAELAGVASEPTEPTEQTFDETVLGRELGPVLYELNYASAIRLGILPPFRVVHYGLSLNPVEFARYRDVSREITDLRKTLETRTRRGLALLRWCRSKANTDPRAGRLISLTTERKRLLYRMSARSCAVAEILRDAFVRQPDSKAILFHESIDEVMSIFVALRKAGHAVVAEHSEFPDSIRAHSLELFRSGAARVIVSARSLIEGFNVPSADIGIIVAASSSVRQRVQTLGRLLRRSKRADGSEKEATLFVLYAAGTVDEVLYEKADWATFIGAERNEYFVWPEVGAAPPAQRDGPPRSPKPSEESIDIDALRPGDIYPGDTSEGLVYSIDTQGTITDAEGRLLKPHRDLLELLRTSWKGAGRFRITRRGLVLRLEKVEDVWQATYLGRLTSPIETADAGAELLIAHKAYIPGDPYPLALVKGRSYSVLTRDRRLIAERVGGVVRFVLPLDQIADPKKRRAIDETQAHLRAVLSSGRSLSKITVTSAGHVTYVLENEAFFAGLAPEGADGFPLEDANRGRE